METSPKEVEKIEPVNGGGIESSKQNPNKMILSSKKPNKIDM